MKKPSDSELPLLLGLLLVTVTSHAAAPEQTRQKLRSLALLPSVTMTQKINTAELQDPDAGLSTNELARRIGELQTQLQKTPNDTELQLQLGHDLAAAGRQVEASNALVAAVQLLRPRAEDNPRDGALQARFARALSDVGNGKEAERVLRDGINAAPEDWNCWVRLGELLDSRELQDLYGGTNRPPADAPLGKQLAAMLPKKPTPDLIKDAQACEDEADKCFDHAVALAPKDPQTYVARVFHRSGHAFVRQMLVTLTTGAKVEPDNWVATMSSREICFDLGRVVHLSPTNPAAIGYWGWALLVPAFSHASEGKPIDWLPDEQRKDVLEAMRMLEGLTDNPNRHAAAIASEDLGLLRLMATGDTAGAKSAFERAVQLDPSREQAWEGLVGLAIQGDPNALVAVCERRVKASDTVRNRIALVKACEDANLSEAALANARAAVKLGPKDPYALVCLGAVLLRQSADPKAESEMKTTLDAALESFKGLTLDDDLSHLCVTHAIDYSIRLGLEGRMDKARELLQGAAAMSAADDSDKHTIKEIETVIGA